MLRTLLDLTPLQLQIIHGMVDRRLLEIIRDLEEIKDYQGGILCVGEGDTLFLAWDRLDLITTPV